MPSRLGFLSATGAAAVAAADGTPSQTVSSPYDFPAVVARLAQPARHRQVFAVPRVADGVVTGLMRHALDAYEVTRNEGPGALHPAAVVYARGVVLGLNDSAWRTYRLADAVRQRGDLLAAAAANGNPYGPQFAELARRGATLLVCDNALADLATYLVVQSGFNERPLEAVHVDLRHRLLPGALLVPAGVAALNDAQEAHFTFVQAS